MASVGTAVIDIGDTAPVLAGIESTNLSYTQGNAPVPITSSLTVSDVDDLNLSGATVAITGGTYVAGQDLLSFTNQNGITGNFNASTGVMSLSGTSSVANYQAALRSVAYSNTSSSPNISPRTITFVANDGFASSNAASRTVNILTVHFVITAPPNPTAGSAFTITVAVRDQSNNSATGYLGTVHFTKSDGGVGSAVPADYAFVPGDLGSRTFTSGVTLVTAGSQTITATDTVSAVITGSATVIVSPAAANHLAFGQQPTNTTAGAAISPAVTVRLLDQFNNLTTSTATVSVNSVGPSEFGGTSTTSVMAVGGIATLSNLHLSTAGTYTIIANSEGLTGATSNSFTISSAAADHLAFGVQPTDTTAAAAISPAVTVQLLDQFNNPTTSTATVAVVASGPGPFTAGSTTSVTAVGGVATFNNLHLNSAGSYTIAASSTGLGGASSSSFNVTAAVADHLAFGQQPTNATAGVPLSPAVTVRLLDQFNNLTTSTANVSVAAAGPSAFTATSNTTVAAVGGIATFSNLVLNTVGGYTIDATSAGATGATSVSFTITPAAAATFTVTAPAAINPAMPFSITVTAKDPFSNIATGYTGTVHFTRSDANEGSVVPADYAFVGGEGGTHTFTNGVTLQTSGPQTVTATDTLTTRITGTSNSIAVNFRPVVTNDNFTAVGNTELRVGTGSVSYPAAVMSGSILGNDSDPDGNTPIAVDIASVNTAGLQGSLFINGDGTFTFLPTVGFSGSTSFQYKAKDSLGNVSATFGTVMITINSVVWYVDSSYAGGNGPSDGTATRPLTALTNLNAAGGSGDLDGPNDYIFVYPGSGTYDGGLEIEAGQKLYGQPFGLSVSGYTLVTAGGGSNPTITNAAGAGITLAEGVEVQRVNVADTFGDGISGPDGLNSATVGSNMSVTNSGQKGLRPPAAPGR
jgi:hypothetical protein